MLCVAWCCGHSTVCAQTTFAASRKEAGREAFASGHYQRAIDLLLHSVDRDGVDPEAHYILAQSYLAVHQLQNARREIARARSLDGESLKFAVAEMEILRASTPPESAISLTDGRRVTLANSILEKDPDNPAALEELGIQHAMSYRWYANFDATRQPLGNGIAKRARKEFEEARKLLRQSIAFDGTRLSAYAELLRLLIEEGEWVEASELAEFATETMPQDRMSWLFGGLVAQLQNQSERAQPLFRRAIELMSDSERRAFVDVSLFLDEDEQARFRADPNGFSRKYWAERDPFRLTEVNEREMDHYARLAFCRLWYGGDESPGWDAERGRIVVRYGIPWSDASFVAGYSRFNALEYRDFDFVFEDITRGGHYTMYSPKAGPASSWKNDYVIQAAEMAKSTPELYDPKFLTSVDLLAETTSFRGSAGGSDVYVHIWVPAAGESDSTVLDARVGAFLIDASGDVLDRATGRLDVDEVQHRSSGHQMTKKLAGAPGLDRIEVEYLSDDRSSAGHVELEIEIPSFASDTLTMSDLLPASAIDRVSRDEAAGSGRLRRGEYSIEPMPWVRLNAGTDLLIYFELYGLDLDASGEGSYRISALLEKANESGLKRFLSGVFGGGGGAKVAASIESKSSASDEARFVSIALPSDLSGDYRLILEVTDLLDGQSVRRTHDFNIVE